MHSEPASTDWLNFLRPSAVTALVRLRRRMAEQSGISPIEARKVLGASFDNAALDFDSALFLHKWLPPDRTLARDVYQGVIDAVVEQAAPPWLALVARGREAIASLDADTVACFRRAGAFDPAPDPDVIQWWDRLAAFAYADRDLARCATGREAERRSLMLERIRLGALPGAPAPVWKALDSNLAGYDIQSWIATEERLQPKYIEVKGSLQEPPSFFVTRNEWDTATRNLNFYVFHIWQLRAGLLLELPAADIAGHIPNDRGAGRWQELKIEVRSCDWISPA